MRKTGWMFIVTGGASIVAIIIMTIIWLSQGHSTKIGTTISELIFGAVIMLGSGLALLEDSKRLDELEKEVRELKGIKNGASKVADSNKVFTPKSTIEVYNKTKKKKCKNCGAEITGDYCYSCNTQN